MTQQSVWRSMATIGAAAVLVCFSRPAAAEGIKEVEISCDPPSGGQQIFTVRLRPDKNHICDRVAFDCVLAQETKVERPGLSPTNRVHEPAMYTYRRKDVKFVDDLDCFVSFRVPVSLDRLKEIYGATTFHTNVPVKVSRIKIAAEMGDDTAWQLDVPVGGVHQVKPDGTVQPVAPPPPPPPPAKVEE